MKEDSPENKDGQGENPQRRNWKTLLNEDQKLSLKKYFKLALVHSTGHGAHRVACKALSRIFPKYAGPVSIVSLLLAGYAEDQMSKYLHKKPDDTKKTDNKKPPPSAEPA